MQNTRSSVSKWWHRSLTPQALGAVCRFSDWTGVVDTAYIFTAIARLLNLQGIALLSTYRGPQTKDGFFPNCESVYDEQYDCSLCPENEVLHYHTTNRDGHRAYCSDPKVCGHCPHLMDVQRAKHTSRRWRGRYGQSMLRAGRKTGTPAMWKSGIPTARRQ